MDDAAYEAARNMLEQIADVLGIPVQTFLAPSRGPVTPATAAKQEEELLRLFRKVHDADMRERVLHYMRVAVNKTSA